MSTTMDQIHHIREMYSQQDKNISQIASETGLNRKTNSKYVDMEDFNSPPPTPASSEVHESKLDSFKPLIDEWLQADKLAPRKQRHTAKRVYKRLKDEADGFDCSYRLVALYSYVEERRRGSSYGTQTVPKVYLLKSSSFLLNLVICFYQIRLLSRQ